VQRVIRDAGHCGFTSSEWVACFDALVDWVEKGVKPKGNDVLTVLWTYSNVQLYSAETLTWPDNRATAELDVSFSTATPKGRAPTVSAATFRPARASRPWSTAFAAVSRRPGGPAVSRGTPSPGRPR
jgi:hypothetical protein